ncbi:MAG TPA: lactate utilization protein C [Bacillales bacterium]|nr:lactate utilization protein C [Bacillales bacterium]
MPEGTIQNRESFLDHIANSLGRDLRNQKVERPDWNYRPQQKVYQGLTQDELVDVLEKACENIHTEIKRTKADQLLQAIEEVVDAHGGGSAVTWDDPRFIDFGLEAFVEDESVQVWDASHGEENIDIAEKANIGITFSDITLAESGTVTLFSDKGKGRSVSLLPKTYIAIIPKSTIVPRMTQATEQIHKKVELGEAVPSCVNFISGPSNSADIEMNLVVGVHGPVQVTYVVVTDR